jgi:hypothetical protein
MVSFKAFLAESKKQYSFRVKVACECNKENLATLNTALSKYELAAISEVKETPIAETHAGFEHLKNIKLSILDVLINYPANPIQIRDIIRDAMGVTNADVMVTTPGEDANVMPVPPQQVLGKDYPTEKKLNVLSDLDSALKDHKSTEFEFAAKLDAKGKTTNDLPTGTVSPVGSKQNKVPKAKQ